MPSIHTVLATVPYQGAHLERLRAAVHPAGFIHLPNGETGAIAAVLPDIDVAIVPGDPDPKLLEAPKLSWIHCDHAGMNNAAKPYLFTRELTVTSSAGRSAPVLAEHAIFFMLALVYRFPQFYEAQRAHRWGIPNQDSLRGLYGRTVGIIGMGHTGKEVAVRAKACGMRVLGFRRRTAETPPGVDHVYCIERGDRLKDLLEQADFLVLTLPLSDQTHHLIGERELGMMKPGSYLINMARGAIVDEAALCRALYDARLAGAGLDTFAIEPLSPEHPLWDAPNTLITPHITPQVPDRTGRSLDIITENIRLYRANEPLLNVLSLMDIYTK